jgi:hypothetical protein
MFLLQETLPPQWSGGNNSEAGVAPCINIAGQATGKVKTRRKEGEKIASRPRVGVNESSAVTTL